MNSFLQETAERLAVVFADENTNGAIDDVLKDIIIDLENESEINSYHPEVIKIVYPLMIEALGERGKGYHSCIRWIIENQIAIDQTLFDGMGAPYVTSEQIEQAEKDREAKEKPLDLSETTNLIEDECLDLAKAISDVITSPLLPTRLHNALADEVSSLGNGKALRELINSPEYLAKAICEELESEN